MDKVLISFDIESTDITAPLGVRVKINNHVIFEQTHVQEPVKFFYDQISDDEDHEYDLTIEMFGKLPEHTQLNDQGQIVSDSMLMVKNIQFDSVDIYQAFLDMASYHHDFNGTQAPVVDKFFGNMGCNGQVGLKFTTPIYLWLLEIM
jgi:hypothetical protein